MGNIMEGKHGNSGSHCNAAVTNERGGLGMWEVTILGSRVRWGWVGIWL